MTRTRAEVSRPTTVTPPWEPTETDGRGPRRVATLAPTAVAAIIVVTVLIASGAGAGISATQSDRPTVAVVGATVPASDTATVRVALTGAPDGLAGYYLRVSVADAGVARIESASYPDQFGMTTDPAVSGDGRTVTLEAADVDAAIEPGASDVTLATVTVSGVAPGEVGVTVDPIQFDADGGAAIAPAARGDAITVTSADGVATDAASGSTPGANGDGSGVDGDRAAETDGTGRDADRSVVGKTGDGDGVSVAVVVAGSLALVTAGLAIGRRF